MQAGNSTKRSFKKLVWTVQSNKWEEDMTPRVVVPRFLSVRFAVGYRSPCMIPPVTSSYILPLGSVDTTCQHVFFATESSRERGLWVEPTYVALGRQMTELGAGSSSILSLSVPPNGQAALTLLFLDKHSPPHLLRMHSACTDLHTAPSLEII